MSSTNVDLKQAVADRDLYVIQCFVVDQQNLLLKDWLDESHTSFHSNLQRSLQKSHRTKRQLVAPEDEIPYQLGVWEGWIQAFRALYDEANKENDILEAAVAKSPNTAKIIRFLYHHGRPICHGELADALGMHYNTLTNAMKRVIECGAVSASRTGRNTRYTLTPAARQYCRKETQWEKVVPKSREELLLEELIKLYQSKQKPGSLSASVGDSVRISEKGVGLSEQKRLARIIQIGGEKILDLEPADLSSDVSDISVAIVPDYTEKWFRSRASHLKEYQHG